MKEKWICRKLLTILAVLFCSVWLAACGGNNTELAPAEMVSAETVVVETESAVMETESAVMESESAVDFQMTETVIEEAAAETATEETERVAGEEESVSET